MVVKVLLEATNSPKKGAVGDDELLESTLAQGPRGWRQMRMLEQRCSECLKLKVGRTRASLAR